MSASPEEVHDRVLALKARLAAKKTEAGNLFTSITADNSDEHRLKSQLTSIRDILKGMQGE